MTRSRKKLVGFGIVAYLVSVYLFFPLETVLSQLVIQAAKSIPGFGFHYDRMKPSLLFDTHFENVTLLKGDTEATLVPFLVFKDVSVDLSYLSLLRGKLAFDVVLSTAKGDLEASVMRSGSVTTLDLVFDGVGLEMFSQLKTEYGLNMSGHVYGKGNITWDASKVTNSVGNLLLDFRDFVLAQSQVMIPIPGTTGPGIPFTLPTVRLSGRDNSGLELTLGKGQIQVSRFELLGEDLELSMTGKLNNVRRMSQMRVSLKGELGVPSEELSKTLAIVLAQADDQKDKDGKYPFALSGPVEKLQVKIGRKQLWPMGANRP